MKKSNKNQPELFTTQSGALKHFEDKKQRLLIFRRIIRNWEYQCILNDLRTGEEMPIPPEEDHLPLHYIESEPVKYSEYYRIALGMSDCRLEVETWNDLFLIHQRYWKRICKYMVKKLKERDGDKVSFPQPKHTDAIHELLLRGFVHEKDFIPKKGKYYIKCHIAPLIWPENFDQHSHAIETLQRVGLVTFTGTVIPKD